MRVDIKNPDNEEYYHMEELSEYEKQHLAGAHGEIFSDAKYKYTLFHPPNNSKVIYSHVNFITERGYEVQPTQRGGRKSRKSRKSRKNRNN